MELNSEIEIFLRTRGVEIIHFVDITVLQQMPSMSYPSAILLGIPLTPGYIQKVGQSPNYVQDMIRNQEMEWDEFNMKEHKTDRLADELATYLQQKCYSSYSQSEKNIESSGHYQSTTKRTPLPHKTIALLANMGWIGKHNLLVNPIYGSAISMCTILTNAPIQTTVFTPQESKCGSCKVCIEACEPKALKGVTWQYGVDRDKIIDVQKCTTCLQCMMLCPWTQKFIKKQEV